MFSQPSGGCGRTQAESYYMLGAASLAYIVLIGMVAHSPPTLVHDERYHSEGAAMLVQGASLSEMLRAPLLSAPGPLYPCLHALFFPLTRLTAPAVRWVNVVLLFASIAALAFSIRRLELEQPWSRAAMMLSVPIVWNTSGMALTEVPAFTMATFSVAAMLFGTAQAADKKTIIWVSFVLSGLFAGLAVLGRQTYLPALGTFAFLGIACPQWRLPALCGLGTACTLILPVFTIWGGLVRESQAHTADGVIAVDHGVLALGYFGAVILIIAPAFLAVAWRWVVVAVLLAALANFVVIRFEWNAMAPLAKMLPDPLQGVYPLLAGTCVIVSMAAGIAAISRNVWDQRGDTKFVFLAGLSVALVGTACGVTHLFSSRYVMTGFPFVLLMLQRYFEPSLWAAVRLLVGAALGAGLLSTYYV